MELRLHPEDIKELAKEIAAIIQPPQSEDDIVFLRDLAEQWRKNYAALCAKRIEKHIPKVDGIKEVAILRKYVPELLKKAS
jgi:hypothetical protein